MRITGERAWTEWPAADSRPHRRRRSPTRDVELADDMLLPQVPAVAGRRAVDARARGATGGVALFGDLPFMVSGDSADVWARQDEFSLDVSVGVPPDAFSETGQDWGLPAYRWDVLAERDFDWLRQRARRNADLFDGYRVDHLVGFYRMYFAPARRTAHAAFHAGRAGRADRARRARAALFREPGPRSSPRTSASSLISSASRSTRLGVPGYRVFRWERHWHEPGQPFETRPTIRPCRSRRPARTIRSRW